MADEFFVFVFGEEVVIEEVKTDMTFEIADVDK